MVLGYWLFARLSLLFPAAAVERTMTFRESFGLSRGNGWRLIGVLFLVVAPVSIVYGAWQIVWISGILGSLIGMMLGALIDQSLVFAGIAVGVSALSIAYREFADDG